MNQSLKPPRQKSGKLQKLVISLLILFNRPRLFKVTDISIDEYMTSFDKQDDRPEIIASLEPLGKAFVVINYIPNVGAGYFSY